MKIIKQFLSIMVVIALLISVLSNTSFASEANSTNAASSVKLIDNYLAGTSYYADDAHNTVLANLLFKKEYNSVDNERVDPGRMNSIYDFLTTYKDETTGKTYLHKGMDFKASKSVEVYSPVSGIVLESTPTTSKGCFTEDFGAIVIYDSVHDFSFNFQHLSSKLVNPGDSVSVGQLIAMSGKEGATSYHLHVGLRSGKNAYDGALDNDETTNYDPRIVLNWVTSNLLSHNGGVGRGTPSNLDTNLNIFQNIGNFLKTFWKGITTIINNIISPETETSIVGTWQDQYGATLQFFKDGTFKAGFSNITFLGTFGTYTFPDKSHLEVKYGGLLSVAGPIDFEFVIDGDKLTITNSYGMATECTKIK